MTEGLPPCPQPGCSGRIEDGYCDTCGLAPAPSPLQRAEAAPPIELSPAPRAPAPSAPSAPLRAERSPIRRALRVLRRPVLPPQDPTAALVPAQVPPHRRLCSSCEGPLGPEQGVCPHCRQQYSFVATLRAGELLAQRYEVKGTLAFGGLGWIYLALDVVLGRWVTLKGLLNAHDPKLVAVAVQEREYLAAVKHPNIVSIFDFLTHGREGFIVMEYVNGRSLTALRREAAGPLPVVEALAYLAEALPALQYLGERGLVYCDFKPDNVMVEEDTIKLIDLGAVRRADDTAGDIYGSRGYSAPEAAERPTHRSDLYSAGRTLAVLVATFDYQGAYEHALPPPEECEVFRQHPALLALLRKATDPDPQRRFATAAAMAEQVEGVLRRVADPPLPPRPSAFFDLAEVWRVREPETDLTLPPLRPDPDDEGAALIASLAGVGDARRRRDLCVRGLRLHPGSVDLRLRLIDEHLRLDEAGEAKRRIDELEASSWRAHWCRGQQHLREGRAAEALASFRQVSDELPGELGPRLAEARAQERAGHDAEAAALYGEVARADASVTTALFGLARCRQRLGDSAGARQALGAVPVSSPHHARARQAMVSSLLRERGSAPGADDVLAASEVLESLGEMEGDLAGALLRAETLAAAARLAARGEVRGGTVLGVFFEERALRRAAEQAFRRCARLAEEPALRARLLDEANAVRPWSLF